MTDNYIYDAWGNVTAHGGTTDQPYQYVGRFGYYTHWQDVNLPLLQLGIRYYDLQAGRFAQRDPVISPKEAYTYAENRPVLLVDPEGLYPTFNMTKSCEKKLGTTWAKHCKRRAEQYLDEVERQYPQSNLSSCGYTVITVKCKDDLGETTSGGCVCGKTSLSGPTITISVSPKCPYCFCVMLHEAIHVCSGPVAPGRSGCWGVITVPGCGNISGQHT